MSARVRFRLHWRLSVLWALEWGITGAILTYVPLYFTEKGLTTQQLGEVMATLAVGLWVAPLVVGQVCDRWMATEKYLALAHFLGGLTLVAIPLVTEIYEATGEYFTSLLVLVGVYAVFYVPTVPLASSLTFRHLADPDAQFGRVRIWGTVGWVLAGLVLSLWLGQYEVTAWVWRRFPAWHPFLRELEHWLWLLPEPTSADCFRISALLSFALSSFCVFLPATPPSGSQRGAVAPLETLSMFRDRTFSLLIATSFLLAVAAPFYTLAVPKLLAQLRFDSSWIPAVMTIGQISEFPALLLLAVCLKRYGLKATFGLGMAAWLIRYTFFAFEQPVWLVLAGISLHGVCHVFLIIVIQLFVDSQCRSDLRASAQNVFAFITMGVAMPIGFLLAGTLGQWCINATTGRTDYHTFFSIPAVFVLLLLFAYWKWFQPADGLGEHHASETKATRPSANPVTGEAGTFNR